DCQLYFEWANEESVRENSFNPGRIDWDSHIEWFENKLKNETSKLFVLMSDNNPVGQVRLDKDKEYWVLDYSIDEKYRGKGLATSMIKLLLELSPLPIKAIVKPNNI